MKIELKSSYSLTPVTDYPFPITFSFGNRKKPKYWFTPKGKLVINVYHLNMIHLNGSMSYDDYNSIMSEMKKAKSDILSDGYYYYTTTNNGLVKLPEIKILLHEALRLYNQKPYL